MIALLQNITFVRGRVVEDWVQQRFTCLEFNRGRATSCCGHDILPEVISNVIYRPFALFCLLFIDISNPVYVKVGAKLREVYLYHKVKRLGTLLILTYYFSSK